MTALTYATRRLWADRGPVLGLLITLVLSIWFVVSAVAVADALLLRHWPVPDAERVVVGTKGVPVAEFRFLREQAVTARLAAVAQSCPTLRDASGQPLGCELVSGDYFDVLRITVAMGRPLLPTDDSAGQSAIPVVIGQRVWLEHFGAARSAVGSRLELNGHQFVVVGVAGDDVVRRSTNPAAHVWMPLSAIEVIEPQSRLLTDPEACCVEVVGRRLSSEAAVSQELTALDRAFRSDDTTPPLQVVDTRTVRRTATNAIGVVVALLVFAVVAIVGGAVANVGTIQLARADAMRHTWFVMRALGADRTRMLLPVFWESALLSGAVWAGAMALTVVGMTALEQQLMGAFKLEPSWRVFGVCWAVSACACLLSTLLPHASVSRSEADARVTARVSRRLVVAQVACCTAGLIAAAGMHRGLARVSAELLAEGSPLARVHVKTSDATRAATAQALYRELVARHGETPLLAAASPTQLAFGVSVERGPTLDVVDLIEVDSHYFTVAEVRPVAGRTLSGVDGTRDVVVNETLARRVSSAADIVGRSVRVDGQPWTVIGVVKDAAWATGASAVRPTVYRLGSEGALLFAQHRPDVAASLAAALAHINSSATLELQPVVGAALQRLQRSRGVLAGAWIVAIVATTIALSGLYGVIALGARVRRKEMAIRVALGAGLRRLGGLFIASVGRAVAVGVVLGTAFFWALGPAVRSLAPGSYGVEAPTIIAVWVAVCLVAGLLAVVPAWRLHKEPLSRVLQGE